MTQRFHFLTRNVPLILCSLVLAVTVAMSAITAIRLPVTAVNAASSTSSCAAQPLGPATRYNIFTLGDFTSGNSDTQGRLAAGGNVALTNYSIGASLPSTTTGDTLVIGGTLNFHSGAVARGNAVSHGAGVLEGVTFAAGNSYRQGATLDFAAAGNKLRTNATAYAALPVNGSTTFAYNQLALTGTNAHLNVFAVSGADLSVANSLTVNAPAGSTALIIVSGESIQVQNEGFGLQGLDRAHVLFDFPQATSLTLNNVGIDGSILAPFARIAFDNGAITGQLIGASFIGSAQTNNAPFTGCLSSGSTATATPTAMNCQQFQAIFTVNGTTENTATLVAGPTPQRTSLPIGLTVYYRVLDPITGTVLSTVRSVTVTQSPAGFGTFSVPLAPFGPTTDPQGQYIAQVSSDPAFPAVTTPLGSCTVRTTFILSSR